MTRSAHPRGTVLVILFAVLGAGFLPCVCASFSERPGPVSGADHCGERNPDVRVGTAACECCCVSSDGAPAAPRTQVAYGPVVVSSPPGAVLVRPAPRPWLAAPPSRALTPHAAPSPPLVLRI